MHVLIVGGGIGGLALALQLHRAGIAATVCEQAAAIRELGVGINLLPHSVAELDRLGLLPELAATGIATEALVYHNRHGQPIWREPRGLAAGYPVPQLSIHRGRLQGILHRAVLDRLGAGRVRLDLAFTGFRETERGILATFRPDRGRGAEVAIEADLLVGADGIHSTLRRHFFPEEGPPAWSGMLMWRGVVEAEPFLGGRTMVMAGHADQKAVVYPISEEARARGRSLINWVMEVRLGDASGPPPRREDWSRPGRLDEVMAHFDGWRFPWLDIAALVRATPVFYEYPMVDRDPLPRWSHGRATLLGDAAHPMYPIGSNGASQAILDGAALARCLVDLPVEAALRRYEAERLPRTAELVLANRRMGPEIVMQLVEERAPGGFARLDDVISQAELQAIADRYKRIAGFALERRT
ncbi:MAG: flavin-dependent oxidoreductase [Geminicoccaceae bacterium]